MLINMVKKLIYNWFFLRMWVFIIIIVDWIRYFCIYLFEKLFVVMNLRDIVKGFVKRL